MVPRRSTHSSFFFYNYLFMCLFLVVLGLCCCVGFFPPAAESGGCSLVAVAGSSLQWLLLLLRLQGTWATLFVACGLSSSGFWAPVGVVVHGSSCSTARGSPGSGTEALSPALAGGFCTAEPAGKPSDKSILSIVKGTDGEMLFLDGHQTELPSPPAACHPRRQKMPEEKGKIQPLPWLLASLRVKRPF